MAAIFLPSSPFPQIYSQQTEIVFSTHLHFAMILETFKICFSEKTFSLWQSRLSKEFREEMITIDTRDGRGLFTASLLGALFTRPIVFPSDDVTMWNDILSCWMRLPVYVWLDSSPLTGWIPQKSVASDPHILLINKVVYDYMFWIYTNCRALESSRIFTIYRCEQWLVYKNSLRSHKVE